MAELRKLYEQVLGGAIPGRTFERYIEQLDVLELTGESRSSGGKPAKVYRVKTKKSGLAKIGPSLQTRYTAP
jgi:8-oxo-dGTP diphosphatase